MLAITRELGVDSPQKRPLMQQYLLNFNPEPIKAATEQDDFACRRTRH
jgi:hypothetical protein